MIIYMKLYKVCQLQYSKVCLLWTLVSCFYSETQVKLSNLQLHTIPNNYVPTTVIYNIFYDFYCHHWMQINLLCMYLRLLLIKHYLLLVCHHPMKNLSVLLPSINHKNTWLFIIHLTPLWTIILAFHPLHKHWKEPALQYHLKPNHFR